MSFLQDPKIYKSIVDGAIKTAQERPRPIDVNVVARKLSDNLSRELSNSAPAENITSAGNVGITMDNLYSLPTLLQFLSQNKLKVSGKQIVYTKDEAAAIPDASGLSQIDEYFVDADALSKYMNHLQEKAKADDNALLQTSLVTLIDQINTTIPNANIGKKKEKSTPESPNVLPDTTVLDRFQKKIFDPKNPMAHTGNDHLLFASNLKSAGALNAWLRDAGEATVVMYNNNQPTPVSFFSQNANRCIVPQVLYKRALQFYNTGDEDQRRVYSHYMKRVQELVGQFTGPNNEACTLEYVAPSTEQGAGAAAAPGGPGGVTDTQLVQSVPLRMRDLSFQRIKFFFDQYKKFNRAELNPGIQTAINNAVQGMQYVSAVLTNPGMDLFNLNASAAEINDLVKPPVGNVSHYLQFLNYLESILVNTGYVIRSLQSAFGEKDIGRELQNIIGQQIGYGSGSGSIYGSNLNNIARLKSLARHV